MLSALCLAKATIPSSIVENVHHQEEVVSIGNIEALSCAMECRDASTSNALSVTSAMGTPLRYIPRHDTPRIEYGTAGIASGDVVVRHKVDVHRTGLGCPAGPIALAKHFHKIVRRAELAGRRIVLLEDSYRIAMPIISHAEIEKTKTYFRETMFRGPIIWRTVMRSNNAHDYKKIRRILEKGWAETDPRVEKELIRFSVEEFYKNIPQEYWGEFQKSLKEQFADDYSAITDYIWDDSVFASPENAERLHGKEDILIFYFRRD